MLFEAAGHNAGLTEDCVAGIAALHEIIGLDGLMTACACAAAVAVVKHACYDASAWRDDCFECMAVAAARAYLLGVVGFGHYVLLLVLI